MSILEVVSLSKQVDSPNGPLTIVEDVNFTITAGESVAICGPSGAGKSTLLALLAGLDVPSQGQVRINGSAFSETDEDNRAILRGQLIGFVFQSFHLIPGLTALENVLLPLELSHIPQARAIACDALTRMGLHARLDHYPKQLSGGEQQRVAIARALVRRPALLMADEPTGNLDERTGLVIEDQLFERQQQDGAALLIITHDPRLAKRCDRTLWMHNGRVHANESNSASLSMLGSV